MHIGGNSYSVPIAHVGTSLTVRVHQERIVVFAGMRQVASHHRSSDGAGKRIVDPAHFAPVFAQKPRAQVMLYRDTLLQLGDGAAQYISEVSRRRRDRLREEVLGIYAVLERHGAAVRVAAIERAAALGAYGAEYLEALLQPTSAPAHPLAALPLHDLPTPRRDRSRPRALRSLRHRLGRRRVMTPLDTLLTQLHLHRAATDEKYCMQFGCVVETE